MFKKSLILIMLLSLFFAAILEQEARAKRIVSLAPSVTEILFSLDLEKQIVGVTANCDYPSSAKKIEKVGLFEVPNLEKIISLKPNLVLTDDLGWNPAIFKLKDLNIQTVVLPSQNMQDVLKSIKTVGRITDREEIAKILVNKMQKRINAIKEKVANRSRPKVLLIIWVNPNQIITAGRKSFIDELISLAGGDNITADINFRYPTINTEFIFTKNPEVIIFGDKLMNSKKILKDLLTHPGIKNTKAVKSARIYRDVNPDLFLRPGPRLIDGLEEIAKRLHPNLFITKGENLNGKT